MHKYVNVQYEILWFQACSEQDVSSLGVFRSNGLGWINRGLIMRSSLDQWECGITVLYQTLAWQHETRGSCNIVCKHFKSYWQHIHLNALYYIFTKWHLKVFGQCFTIKCPILYIVKSKKKKKKKNEKIRKKERIYCFFVAIFVFCIVYCK